MRKERTANDAGLLIASARARNALGAGVRRVEGALIDIGPGDENGIVVSTTGGMVTLAKNLPDGFRCKVACDHAGQTSFRAAAGASLGNVDGKFALAAPDAIADILVKRNDDGESAAVVLAGKDVAAYNDTTPWTARAALDTQSNGTWRVRWIGGDVNKFFVPNYATGSPHDVSVSVDGINWSAADVPTDSGFIDVAHSPELGLLVLVPYTGTAQVAVSSDGGATWVAHPIDDNGYAAVVWADSLGLFVAVSYNDGKFRTSPDGINWTATDSEMGSGFESLCWSHELGLLVAVTDYGESVGIVTSSDAVNWTARDYPGRVGNSSGFGDIAWSPELGIFAVTDDYNNAWFLQSEDGISWQKSALLTQPNQAFAICWAAELGLFIAPTDSNVDIVLTSPDGKNWTETPITVLNGHWTGVAWSPVLGMAVATQATGSGRIMTSNPL